MEVTLPIVHSEIIHDKTKFLFLYGTRGGGKSVTAKAKVILNCLEMPKLKFLVARKTRNSLKNTSERTVKELLTRMEIPYNEIKSDHTIEFANKSVMVFDGLYTSEGKNEKLKSTNWGGIEIDEATEPDFADIKDLLPSLRDRVGYRQVIFDFNPPRRSNHWIYKFYDEQLKRGKAEKIFFSYKDNPFLPDDYGEELESIKDYDVGLWKRYARGQWKVDTLVGLVYENFKVIDFDSTGLELFGGIDHGYNHAAAFVLMGFSRLNPKRLFVIHEIYEKKKTAEDFGKMMRNYLKGIDLNVPLYADPSSPGSIKVYQNLGLNVKKGDNSVLEGIDFVKTFHLLIKPENVNVIHEIENYQWQTDKKSGEAIDAPVKFEDHAMDAIRYAVYTHLKWLLGRGEEKDEESEIIKNAVYYGGR